MIDKDYYKPIIIRNNYQKPNNITRSENRAGKVIKNSDKRLLGLGKKNKLLPDENLTKI